MRSAAPRTILLASILVGTTAPALAGMQLSMDDPVTLTECDERVRERPREYESYLCYWIVSRRGPWEEAARRLDALLSIDPANPKALLYRGVIDADHHGGRAETLDRQAIEGFVASGETTGEFYARMALHSLLSHQGRVEEADPELEVVLALAAGSGDPEHLLGAGLVEARSAFREARYAHAWALYARLDAEFGADAPSWLAFRLLAGQGQTAWALGRLEEAMRYSREAAELVHDKGNTYAEAIHRYFVAEIGWELAAAGRRSPEEARDLRHRALSAALRGEHRGAEALARLLAARDPELDLAARLAETRRALELEADVEHVDDLCLALRLLAALRLEEDPSGNLEEALALIDRAILLSREAGRPRSAAAGFAARAVAGIELRGRDAVVDDLLAAIAAIEGMRDLQWDRLVRARFLWSWASPYYRLSAFLWDLPRGAYGAEDAELAFHTIERLRGRMVTDLLDPRRGERPGSLDGALSSTMGRIALLQRRLLSPGLSEAGRAAALRELDGLEVLEAEARHGRARSSPFASAILPAAIPDSKALRSSLAAGQVLVSFQIPPREPAGEYAATAPRPWSLVVTPERVAVVPLPEREWIERSVELFLGLLRRRDGSEREAAGVLYRDLLGRALDAVPGTGEHLVLVPDGILHRLPFGALRDDRTGEPLAATHAISLVPSATLWHHWKTAPAPMAASVLSLANPRLPSPAAEPAEQRAGSLARELDLGPLPGARAEARSIARHLGSDSRLLEGDEASEHRLKGLELERFGLVHVAAHAVVDDLHPRRSALLLAPGAPEQDGLLQIPEIAALDLRGSVVILSACSSATGEVTVGEGVFGLAGAFFRSGARAVVAGLWPLRDREAEALIGGFARHLAEGRTVADALTRAQRDQIRQGVPVAAWAGMVVLGEGDRVVVPGGRREPRWLVWAGLLLFLTALMGSASWRRLPRR